MRQPQAIAAPLAMILLLLLVVAHAAEPELWRVAQRGDLAEVKRRVEAGESIDAVNPDQETILFVAARMGRADLVEYLLAKGANVTQENKHGWTPVLVATEYNANEVVPLLIEHGADVNTAHPFDGETILSVATRKGHTEIVEFLIENGANIDAGDKDGMCGLHLASKQHSIYNSQTKILEIFVAKGANLNLQTKYGYTPLHFACVTGSDQIVAALLKYGALTDVLDEDGMKPIDYARLLQKQDDNHGKCANLITQHIARLPEGEAQLKYAEQQAKERNRVEASKSGLWRAAERGDLAEVKRFVELGESIETVHPGFQEPILLVAARNKHTDVVEYLLAKGANIDHKNKSGRTALHTACLNNKPEDVDFLIQNGADLDVLGGGYSGETPLYFACKYECVECVDILLRNGARTDPADLLGKKPIDFFVCAEKITHHLKHWPEGPAQVIYAKKRAARREREKQERKANGTQHTQVTRSKKKEEIKKQQEINTMQEQQKQQELRKQQEEDKQRQEKEQKEKQLEEQPTTKQDKNTKKEEQKKQKAARRRQAKTRKRTERKAT
eukprot:TRINITY_DN12679_c0_g1_i1.p1 TRINITY_DN12679_c0_g1~~TRINITY_DN12679_c0_g1_i1.p1  ORF type:complete len:559 (+),score=168.21 TRINITY_DN12679_c0_g1_i1:8-1684(+)